ncbi:MAG: hypothetical protein ABII82_00420, partial [Verrucomicrobiota bacterium]
QKPGRPAKPERFAKAQPARAPQVVSEPVGRDDARPVFKLKKHSTQPESTGSPFTPPGYVDSPRPGKKPRPAKSQKINPRGKTGKAGQAPAKPKPKPKSSRRPSKKQRRD